MVTATKLALHDYQDEFKSSSEATHFRLLSLLLSPRAVGCRTAFLKALNPSAGDEPRGMKLDQDFSVEISELLEHGLTRSEISFDRLVALTHSPRSLQEAHRALISHLLPDLFRLDEEGDLLHQIQGTLVGPSEGFDANIRRLGSYPFEFDLSVGLAAADKKKKTYRLEPPNEICFIDFEKHTINIRASRHRMRHGLCVLQTNTTGGNPIVPDLDFDGQNWIWTSTWSECGLDEQSARRVVITVANFANRQKVRWQEIVSQLPWFGTDCDSPQAREATEFLSHCEKWQQPSKSIAEVDDTTLHGFYLARYKGLYARAMKYGLDDNDILDVLQELGRLAKQEDSEFDWKTPAQTYRYLEQRLHWLCLGCLRKKAAIEAISIDSGEKTTDLIDDSSDPTSVTSDVEELSVLREAVENLDPKDREILRLRFWENLSYVDIAKRIGVKSHDTARRHCLRAQAAVLKYCTSNQKARKSK